MIDSDLIDAIPERLPDNFMEAVFDVGLLTGNLLVRNFRNGDRFRPLGMKGHKKVKDLFIAKQLPRLPPRVHASFERILLRSANRARKTAASSLEAW